MSERRRRVVVAFAAVLFVVGVAWPIVDIGPRGQTVLTITPEHGVDTSDVVALGVVLLALSLAFFARR